MPVWRFKTLEEAEQALRVGPGDPSLEKTWDALYALSVLAPVCPPTRGVRTFASIEEANADTEEWISRRVAAGRSRVEKQT